MHDPDCIFCKIAAGTIPCAKVYEDEALLGFKDINPAAPVHLLLIPKRHIVSLQQVGSGDQELLGKMLLLVPQLAAEHGCSDGFKTVINSGRNGGQEVFHLHLHILGGPRPWARASV